MEPLLADDPTTQDLLRQAREGSRDAFDALVDISDPVRILGWLFVGAPEPQCLAAAAANGDAVIDISDATYLLGFLFLGGPSPQAPFPACGESERPADRTLGCFESRCP